MSTEIITQEESARLAELEAQIESSVAMVGRALFEIRESRLYRITHSTFEDYCRERFAMNRDYIDKQIKCAEVIKNLHTNCMDVVPKNEAQARPLAKLPAEKQPAAWEKAQEKAKEEGKPVAARHVEQAVAEIMPKKEQEPEPEPMVVDGTRPADAKNTKLSPYQPNIAEDCWVSAKLQLERIHPNDKSRESALNKALAYIQSRISKNI